MRGDAIIKLQIEKALKSNTVLIGSKITVAVHDGAAFLCGTTDKYPKKELAKKIAKDVMGVKVATEKINVVLNDYDRCTDHEIASAINEKFQKNFGVYNTEIKLIVREGTVWLEGRLKWKYQKDLAKECIINVKGIKEIENNISIPEPGDAVISEKDVFAAIYGDSSITTDIKIEIIGRRVVLKGKVHSVEQKNLVTRLVRNVPGVLEVENFLTIHRPLNN